MLLSDQTPVSASRRDEPIAPDAFAITGNTIYLDDPLKQAIRTYTDGIYRGSIPTRGVSAIDLQTSGSGALTTLDNSNTVRTYAVTSATAARLTSKSTLAAGTMTVASVPVSKADAKLTGFKAAAHKSITIPVRTKRLNSVAGGLVGQLSNGSARQFSGGALTAASVAGSSAEHFARVPGGFDVLNPSGAVVKRIRVPYNPETIETIYRGGGKDYYLVCDSYSGAGGVGVFNGYVFAFTSSGVPAGVYTLKNSSTFVPNREVQIDNGNVYQLLVDNGKAQVLRLSPDASGFTRAADFRQLTNYASGITVAKASKKVAKPRKESLRSVTLLAWANMLTPWTYTKKRNGKVPKGRASVVKAPSYIAALTTSTAKFHGVPYTWGGWDTLRTSTNKRKWANFAAGVKAGMYTGNVTSKSRSWVTGTTGVDCSGFVSALFELPSKQGTGNLLGTKYFDRVATFAPQAGDILVRAGQHVIVYLGKLDDNQWLIAESTTADKVDKVIYWTQNPRRLSSMGYKVGHYRNLVG